MSDKFEELFQKALAAVQAAEAGSIKLDVTGTCQACFRSFVVKRTSGSSKYVSVRSNEVGKIGMVLHGFERPGYGYLQGMCWGAGRPPYELSCDLTKLWRKELFDQTLPRMRSYLARLKSGEIKTFSVALYSYEVRELGLTGFAAKMSSIMVTEGQPLPPILQKRSNYEPNYDQLRSVAIKEAETEIEGAVKFIAFLDERIKNWRYAPDKFIPRQTHPSELTGRAWFEHPEVWKLMREMPSPEGGDKTFREWADAFPHTMMWTSSNFRSGGRSRTPSYYRRVRQAFDKMPAVQKAGLVQAASTKKNLDPVKAAKEEHTKLVLQAFIGNETLVAYLRSCDKDMSEYDHGLMYGDKRKPAVAGQPTLYDKFVGKIARAESLDLYGDRQDSRKRITSDLRRIAADRKIKIKAPKVDPG